MTNHIKRMASPNTWSVSRKTRTYITKPLPGAHAMANGLSLNTILVEYLGIARNRREVKFILQNKEVLVDGKRVKEPKHCVGLMDVLSFPEAKQHYRIQFSVQGKLIAQPIADKDAKGKICKVTGKSTLKKNIQHIHLHDAKNIATKDPFRVGDSAVLTFGKGIAKRLELKKDAFVFLTGGKHLGYAGTVKDIIAQKRADDSIVITSDGHEITTLKKHAFVIGDKQPEVEWK